MAIIDSVNELLNPILADLDVALYDLEYAGGVLRVTITRPTGVDLDAISAVNRELSRSLDLHEPISGNYTLEVTSPGLERKLRTDAHWESAIGEDVKIKLRSRHEGDRRVRGKIESVDDSAVTLRKVSADSPDVDSQVVIDRADIDSAKTVYEWKPTPKPGAEQAGDPAEISEMS